MVLKTLVTGDRGSCVLRLRVSPTGMMHPSVGRTRHNAPMNEQSQATGDRKLERAIVLTLLSGEGERRWSYGQLAAELRIEDEPLQKALGRLSEAGVVHVADAEAWASPAARAIDALGLIGI